MRPNQPFHCPYSRGEVFHAESQILGTKWVCPAGGVVKVCSLEVQATPDTPPPLLQALAASSRFPADHCSSQFFQPLTLADTFSLGFPAKAHPRLFFTESRKRI
jgi:hypothetical protein